MVRIGDGQARWRLPSNGRDLRIHDHSHAFADLKQIFVHQSGTALLNW